MAQLSLAYVAPQQRGTSLRSDEYVAWPSAHGVGADTCADTEDGADNDTDTSSDSAAAATTLLMQVLYKLDTENLQSYSYSRPHKLWNPGRHT